MGDSLDEMSELLSLVEQSWKVRALEAEIALERANEQIEKLRLEILEMFGQVRALRADIKKLQRKVTPPWGPPDDQHQDGYYLDAERVLREKYLWDEKLVRRTQPHDWMKHILEGDT